LNSNHYSKSKRKALIIAVSDYDKMDNLEFCKNDGEEINRILLSHNYDIPDQCRLIGRVDGHLLRERVIDFFTDPYVTLEDTLVLYYSGHGVPDGEGGVYLGPSEIDEYFPYKRGFSFQELAKMMNRSLSKKIVVILDCCYSGAAEISKGGEHDAAKLGNAAILNTSNAIIEGEGRCILASSQLNQEAFALKEDNHSVFTHFLIRGLNGEKGSIDNNGNITADSLGKFVYDGIMSLPFSKRPKQKPVRKMDISGEIVIANYPQNSLYGKIVEKEPSIDDIGKQYLENKDYKKALEYYERSIVEPSKAELWVNKGIVHHKLGNNPEALKCFEIAVALDPNNAKALGLKGTTLFNLEKYEDALQILQKSIDLDPTDENIWFGKGMCLHRLRKLEDALSCMNKSLEIDPKANLAMTYKGEILKEREKHEPKVLGKHEQSLFWFDEALKVDPTLPLPWYFKGSLLSELDRKEEANYCYDKAIEYFENYPMDPGIDVVWNPKGNCLADLGRHSEALQCYTKAIENNPHNGVYWVNKALTLSNLKRLKESIDCAEHAMIVDSTSSEVIQNGTNLMICLGNYLCILDKYDEAAKCFERLYKLDSKNEVAVNGMNMAIKNPKEMKKIALNSIGNLPWLNNSDSNINWNEVLEKRAYGIGNYDFGVVNAIEIDHIVTRRGIIIKDKFYLPKDHAERFDGHILWFRITKDEAHRYQRD
jgi:tetratricopeptide (TPR) repeat protein